MGHRIKSQKIYVWVSPELRKEIDEACETLGFAKSEFVRQAIMHYLAIIPKSKKKEKLA